MMAITIIAPESLDEKGFKVYLAGAIDMGKAVDWQAQVIEALSDVSNLVLFNPRRKQFTPDTMDEQIKWELEAMARADLIMMWFPAEALAPIALFETGLYMNSGKLLIGAEQGFYRRRNLELTCRYYDIPLFARLDQLIAECWAEAALRPQIDLPKSERVTGVLKKTSIRPKFCVHEDEYE